MAITSDEIKQITDALKPTIQAPVVSVPHENTKTDIASYLSSGLLQTLTLAIVAYLGVKTPPVSPTPPAPVAPIVAPADPAVVTKLVSDVADLQAWRKVSETPVKK